MSAIVQPNIKASIPIFTSVNAAVVFAGISVLQSGFLSSGTECSRTKLIAADIRNYRLVSCLALLMLYITFEICSSVLFFL